MNRRSFFNMLGSAVIGTVIALKIPDVIAPTTELINKSINFVCTERKYKFWLAQKQHDYAHELYNKKAEA